MRSTLTRETLLKFLKPNPRTQMLGLHMDREAEENLGGEESSMENFALSTVLLFGVH